MSASASDNDPSKTHMRIVGNEDISLDPQAYGLELVARIPDAAGELSVFARYRENKSIADLTAYRGGKPHEDHTKILMEELIGVQTEDVLMDGPRAALRFVANKLLGCDFRPRSQENTNKAQVAAAIRRKAKRPYYYSP